MSTCESTGTEDMPPIKTEQSVEGLHKPCPVEHVKQSEPIHKGSSAPARCPSDTIRSDSEKILTSSASKKIESTSETIAMVSLGQDARVKGSNNRIRPIPAIESATEQQERDLDKKSTHSHPIPPLVSQSRSIDKKRAPVQLEIEMLPEKAEDIESIKNVDIRTVKEKPHGHHNITEWSDDEEAGGLPRTESRVSRVSRAVRQLFCCGVPYEAPSEDNISDYRTSPI